MYVRFTGRTARPNDFKVGCKGDKAAETVVFELPELDEDQVAKVYWVNGEHKGNVTLTDNAWIVGTDFTQYVGEAACYIAITVGETCLWHSETFWVRVVDLPDSQEWNNG